MSGTSTHSQGPSPLLQALMQHGFPTQPGPALLFEATDAPRFAAGFPFVRRVTDEPVALSRAVRLAEEALDAVDPILGFDIPEAVARAYLVGYAVGVGLYVGENCPVNHPMLREKRGGRMQSGQEIDANLLTECLRARAVGVGDPCGRWRFLEVLALFEHFLGPDRVALLTAHHLLEQCEARLAWGDILWMDAERANAAPHQLALALPWTLRRVSPDARRRVLGILAQAPDPTTAPRHSPRLYYALLRWIQHPQNTEALGPVVGEALLRLDDADALERHLDDDPSAFFLAPARAVWMVGTRLLADKLPLDKVPLAHLVAQLSPIRDPGVVRVMAHVTMLRNGSAQAMAWIRQHADYARPILETLAKLDDGRERRAAAFALDQALPLRRTNEESGRFRLKLTPRTMAIGAAYVALVGLATVDDLYTRDDHYPLGKGIGARVGDAEVFSFDEGDGYTLKQQRTYPNVQAVLRGGKSVRMSGVLVQLRGQVDRNPDGKEIVSVIAKVGSQDVDLRGFQLSPLPRDATDAEALVRVPILGGFSIQIDRRTSRVVPGESKLRPGMALQPGVQVESDDGVVATLVGQDGNGWRVEERWRSFAPIDDPQQAVIPGWWVAIPALLAISAGVAWTVRARAT